MRKQVILLLSLFITFVAFSQERTCATMENLEYRKQADPNLESRMDAIELFTQQKIQEMQNNKVTGSIITIPVVVHVLYRNSTENISVAQIQSQLDVLNEDFRRTNSNADNAWSQAADTQIEFCLASIDPNGNSTSGITRKSTTRQDWGANDEAKSTSTGGINPWNTAEYLNMWIVPKMTTVSQGQTINLLGYAQFPGGAAATDGLVMIYNAFGRVGAVTAPFDEGRTTTHEIGHYFNLRHIWGDSNCGNDFVSDTPTHQTSNSGCPIGQQSCSSTDMPQNYMDYTNDSCMNLFTLGQKNRMRAVLESGGARRTLALSDKCGGTPTPTCSDGIQNGNETGVDCGGSCTPCSTDTGCSSTISSFPYSEGYENTLGAWTQSSADDINWTIDASGTPSSGTGPSSASQGTYYVYVEASGNGTGFPNKQAIINSPCYDLTGKTTANFTFKYHMYGSTDMGSIALEASGNNGATWSSVWSKTGNLGNSWLSADIDLSAYLGGSVKLRFNRITGGTWEADVAIDDVKFTATSGGGSNSNCSGGITSFPYNEGYENTFGAWTQSSADDINWTVDASGTPSSGTGPSSASQGTYYVYVEASGNGTGFPNKQAIINSPCYDLTGKTAANFTFKYHMYGSTDMGSITLEASDDNGSTWTSLWSKTGNLGNSWLLADVNLSDYLGDSVQLRFNRITGGTWKADVAIDDVKLTATSGGGSSNTNVTLSITFDDYPEETSWEIKDSNNTIVASGGTYASQADRSTLNISGDFATGCYTFIMKDAYGDGMCCSYGNGSYTLTNNANGSVLASGGSYTSSDATGFCLGGATNRYNYATTGYEATVGFNLYPNPAKNKLHVAMFGAESQSYEIYNSLGQLVLKGTYSETVNISKLKQGLYIYKIFIGEKSKTKRFVKQ